jgi:hypothetical protein
MVWLSSLPPRTAGLVSRPSLLPGPSLSARRLSAVSPRSLVTEHTSDVALPGGSVAAAVTATATATATPSTPTPSIRLAGSVALSSEPASVDFSPRGSVSHAAHTHAQPPAQPPALPSRATDDMHPDPVLLQVEVLLDAILDRLAYDVEPLMRRLLQEQVCSLEQTTALRARLLHQLAHINRPESIQDVARVFQLMMPGSAAHASAHLTPQPLVSEFLFVHNFSALNHDAAGVADDPLRVQLDLRLPLPAGGGVGDDSMYPGSPTTSGRSTVSTMDSQFGSQPPSPTAAAAAATAGLFFAQDASPSALVTASASPSHSNLPGKEKCVIA